LAIWGVVIGAGRTAGWTGEFLSDREFALNGAGRTAGWTGEFLSDREFALNQRSARKCAKSFDNLALPCYKLMHGRRGKDQGKMSQVRREV